MALPSAFERSVFEQLLFACCLENAHYDRAELAYAALTDTGSFFDFNEIRVSTVRELSEAMACLPDPPAAANRVKRVLQSVFESTYSYDLEELRKQNLGPAVDQLKKLDGATNFCVAYVTQSALGGHAIPVDDLTLYVLRNLRFLRHVMPWHRRDERRFLRWYEQLVDDFAYTNDSDYEKYVEILRAVESVSGFAEIREPRMKAARDRADQLLADLRKAEAARQRRLAI